MCIFIRILLNGIIKDLGLKIRKNIKNLKLNFRKVNFFFFHFFFYIDYYPNNNSNLKIFNQLYYQEVRINWIKKKIKIDENKVKTNHKEVSMIFNSIN